MLAPADPMHLVPKFDTNAGFFTRLSSLIPTTFSLSHTQNVPIDPTLIIPPPIIPPKHTALKVRIVSWNMHDGLPGGDLEQLLGKIPPYVPTPLDEMGNLPDLGDDEEHPYHILVV